MSSVSVASKGQVTIPKRIRDELGITVGNKVEFELTGSNARMRLGRKGVISRIEGGTAILGYAGPRVPISELQGDTAVMRASSRARR